MNQGGKGSSEMLNNYKGLKAWQKSCELCLEMYTITAEFLNPGPDRSPILYTQKACL